MKASIIYYTKTGHSKRIAEVIGKELALNPEDIRNNPELRDIDLLYIVSGIYGGLSFPELIDYAKKLTKEQVKKVVLMTSSGAKTTKPVELRKILESNGIEVLKEEFVCPGGLLFFGGHPNKEDKAKAIEFVRKIKM